MSYAQLLANAAKQSQGVLAELGGAQPGRKNSLYNGESRLAVYGQPLVQNIMLPGGGYRQRTVLTVTATRAQFSLAPVAKEKWTRTDLRPAATYIIDWVDDKDATIYTLGLVRPGE